MLQIILHYGSPPLVYPEYPVPFLWAELGKDGLLNSIGIRVESIEARYLKTLDSLGPAAAEYFLHKVLSAKLQEEIRVEYEGSMRRLKRPKLVHNQESSEIAVGNSPEPSADAHIAQQALRSILQTVEDRLSIDVFPLAWLAPKYSALIGLLKEYESSSFRGILFAEQRQVAATLTWLLARTSETKDWIKCAELMGHGDIKSSGEVLGGMGLKPQDNVVKSFRKGELNMSKWYWRQLL